MKAFIERHPVSTYFALAFIISWGGMLLIVGGPRGLTSTSARLEQLMPLVWLAFATGPSVASLLLTGVVSGRKGLQALLSVLLRWRVALDGKRWRC